MVNAGEVPDPGPPDGATPEGSSEGDEHNGEESDEEGKVLMLMLMLMSTRDSDKREQLLEPAHVHACPHTDADELTVTVKQILMYGFVFIKSVKHKSRY